MTDCKHPYGKRLTPYDESGVIEIECSLCGEVFDWEWVHKEFTELFKEGGFDD